MACAVSFALLGLAQAQPVTGPRSVPMAFTTGFESLKLNQGEHLGLVGGSLLFEAAPGWWLGPAVYGAATGQRGGFFVGGGELQKRWQLHQRLVAVTGVFAGGGGGGGAAVGGGLMLRPALSLLWDLGGWQTGPSVSSIYFPDGHIHSTQLGWILALNDRFAYQDWRRAGQLASTHERSGVGFDRIGLTLGRYRVRGTAQNIDAVGARADQWLTPRFFWSVEAAGAAHGGADGYAEVLGGLGADAPLTPLGLPSLSLGARVSLGLGGGGAVQTGGGSLGKAAGSLTWNLSRNAYVGLETGYASALHGHFRSRYAQLLLGITLDHPFVTTRPGANSPASISLNEWALSLQHVTRASRKTGGEASLETLGLKLNRYIASDFYLSGQAHSAYAGHAGAYSVGLVGAGATGPLLPATMSQHLTAGVELLVGAAGGGGVNTQGGAIAQGMAWLGWRATRDGQVKVGVGQVRSFHGGLSSPLVELSWSQSFGLAER